MGSDGECTDRGAVPCGLSSAHRAHLGTVTPPDPPPLALDDPPDDVPDLASALDALRKHHR